MNTPTVKTVIYPVTDLAAAKSVFGALTGGDPVMDEPYYVQFHVDDIDASLAARVEAGATVHKEVNDFGGSGRKVASVTDPSGNVVGLIQTS